MISKYDTIFHRPHPRPTTEKGIINSIRIWLESLGIKPYKTYSGKIAARLTPERHHALAITAQTTGRSLNELLNEGVDLVIEKHS
ncbi:toxin-antitoxin system HicB family antitoxin [Xenorhabdus bharatensis]|uniref:toxin-antitoxin system HicB family antitoxin n=1 Tax=Xenorhabdus bharatensis TaxID=3136256 RepID=UPI0030F439A1